MALIQEQKTALSHRHGPACVIAGAGTGKTATLSGRITHLVKERKLNPNRVLVTTFTRKATAELYARAYESLGEVAQKLRISTIDAFIWESAQRAVRRGLMRSARLLGEAEQRVLLLQCAWEVLGQRSDDSRSSWTDNADKAGLMGLLENCASERITEGPERKTISQSIRSRLHEMRSKFYLDFAFTTLEYKDLKQAVVKYHEKLMELGAIDYDLLSKDFLRCLKQHKQLRRELASELDAILVDEFQDTSRVQAETLLMLSGKQRNIWVVGDPCQQIYEWRGAGPENLLWFIKKARAKKYYLTNNWRSTQTILNCAYHFLSRRVPRLKKNGMLKPLEAMRDNDCRGFNRYSVYTGTLDRALLFAREQLERSAPALKPSDIAILSRKLDKRTVKEIEEKARANGLKVQFHSSRADRAMEQTIGHPLPWRPGTALKSLYVHPKIQRLLSRSLRKTEFQNLRDIRPLATAAEALDRSLPSQAFTFREAWPALKITQDRDVAVTHAVVRSPDAVQVMTIHAAKGLEFPIVLLMKLGKGSSKSFPNPKKPEESRLAYVGATRARDLLVLVHIGDKPKETLAAFGKNLVPIRLRRSEPTNSEIMSPAISSVPPIIAATHLDLYEQCPLKFAAYHEGRFLPEWTYPQSMGSRMHKALEYYLNAEMPDDTRTIDQCFEKGLRDGDSPLRRLQRNDLEKMKRAYRETADVTSKTSKKILAIEERYRYMHGSSGQVEGVVDAVIERKDGLVVLKEWKTTTEVKSDKKRPYELQARAGALGLAVRKDIPIQQVEIVPLFSPENTISLPYDNAFVQKTQTMLEQAFKDLRDRNYEPQRGTHCGTCQLKPHCPAWV